MKKATHLAKIVTASLYVFCILFTLNQARAKGDYSVNEESPYAVYLPLSLSSYPLRTVFGVTINRIDLAN